MMKYLLIALFITAGLASSGQSTVPYSRDYEFREGVFLNVEQFRNNTPIPKASIVSGIPAGQIDFLSEVMEQKTLTYKDSAGKEQTVQTETVWGYCQNRFVSINFNGSFNRFNVIGTLSLFSGMLIRTPLERDPMGDIYSVNTSYEELHQFVFDTKANKIWDFNVKNMEQLLQDDDELYQAFMKLKKRAKADSIFIYLRKYNEKHPLYLPANYGG
jgi:hypothetical protein